jgi:hypothetical protein
MASRTRGSREAQPWVSAQCGRQTLTAWINGQQTRPQWNSANAGESGVIHGDLLVVKTPVEGFFLGRRSQTYRLCAFCWRNSCLFQSLFNGRKVEKDFKNGSVQRARVSRVKTGAGRCYPKACISHNARRRDPTTGLPHNWT